MVILKDKVIVITGASSGMGKAAAIEFAGKGAKIVLAARRTEKLKELRKFINTFNKNCIYVKTDATIEKEVENLFNKTEEKFGRIDLLVNCVGRGLKSKVVDISYDDWTSVLHSNLTSVFLCSKEAAKRMIKKNIKGHVITVSSIAGLFSTPNYSAYCASKRGVTGFKKSFKWEMRKHSIKSSTIHPFRVNTEFFNAYGKRPGRSQMLSPKDVADYIVAIAQRSIPKRICIRTLNVFKRVYYAVKYSVKKGE
ncbi:SDR family oxidoreductase [Candidatus Woesearchaeota archaeon]|nr:SDR family oxidoreductase [Candidatus Woesearchaeota archaeon]